MQFKPFYIFITLALFYSCKTSTDYPLTGDGDEAYHGFHPQAEAELMATYIDPATGDIPMGIRHKELSYVQTLPKKSSQISKRNNEQNIDWYEAGPANIGGRTRGLAFDINNSDNILAGGTSGGIWKSTDEGQNWELKSIPGTHLNVTSLVQDTRDGFTNNWYYGTGELIGENGWDRGYRARNFGSGIYKSTDNGETWNVLPGSVPGNSTAWDGAFDFVHRIVINPVTGTRIIANNASGIYRSTDDENFPLVLGQIAEHLYNDIAVGSDGTMVAAMSTLRANVTHNDSGGIFVSTDDGLTWENITPPSFPNEHHRSLVTIAPSNPKVAYVLTYTGTILPNGREDIRFHYLNLEDGTSENRTEFLPDFPGSNPFIGPSVQTHRSYCMILTVKPDDENYVILGGVTIFRSTNGFSEPVPSNQSLTIIGGYQNVSGQGYPYIYPNHWVDQHSVVFHPNNFNVIWNSNDSGIYRCSDLSATTAEWEDMSEGYNTTQYFTVAMGMEPNDSRIMGGAQDNGTVYFQENGSTESLAFSDGLAICAGDGSYGYFGENYAYTSLQAGRARRANYLNVEQTEIQTHLSFSLVNVSPPPAANTADMFYIHPWVIDPSDERYMYFPEKNTIWRNSNIEASNPMGFWTKLNDVAAPSNYTITDLAVSNEPAHRLYFGASHFSLKPKLYRLDDAISATSGMEEISISNAPNGAYVHDIAVNPQNSDEIIVVMSNYNILGLYYSNDGGDSWQLIEGNLTGDLNQPGPSLRSAAILPTGNETIYLIGTSSGLFSTCEINGTNTVWEQEAFEEMGNAIAEMIQIRPSDGRIAVATFGRGIFVGQLQLDNVSIQDINTLIDVTMFPNPTKEDCFVQFELQKNAAITIDLLDINGKPLFSVLPHSNLMKGFHNVRVNLSTLQAGFYFIRLKNYKDETYDVIKKLIKI
jgi:type IX secretion system substrate protein